MIDETVNIDEKYMKRALQLARMGSSGAHSNPMVGAVVVHGDKIIGEGYHQCYGSHHAEVNAVNSVSDKNLLKESTLYVTLEPCAHYGKTPPCVDLVIASGFPKVVVGTVDPFGKVNGLGIKKMKDAGIEVITGVLEEECRQLNEKFFTAHEKHRPYITLKWASSSDGFIARCVDGKPVSVPLSTPATQVLVHKLRSENDAIMVAAGTVMADNPLLDTRLWPGRNPIKIVLDSRGDVPSDSRLLTEGRIICFSDVKRQDLPTGVEIITDVDTHDLAAVMERLYEKGITSVLVEGGATMLNRLLNQGLYDSIRYETSPMTLGNEGYGLVKTDGR